MQCLRVNAQHNQLFGPIPENSEWVGTGQRAEAPETDTVQDEPNTFWIMKPGLDGLRLENSKLFSHLKPRWPALSVLPALKQNKPNRQVAHHWEKISDGHFEVKKPKLGYFLTWQPSPLWKAKYRKNTTLIGSASVLNWSTEAKKSWSVLTNNSKEWWWDKKQFLEDLKGQWLQACMHTPCCPATFCDVAFTHDSYLLNSFQNCLCNPIT